MPETLSPAEPAVDPLEDVRNHWHSAQEAESRTDRGRYLSALKGFLAAVEAHEKELGPAGSEVSPLLDEAAMAFARASHPDLARRAVDLGLLFSPGASGLLHHKALILLAQNQDLPEVVALVDKAIEANPHDKGLWATRADALRLQNLPADAVEAYLHAQQLDAASTQYVDKALKLAPHDARVLRAKLDLARALGGDLPALAACDELLASNPEDLDLLYARAELLASLGRGLEALEPLARVRTARPDDSRAAVLNARLLFQLERPDEALPIAKSIVEGAGTPDPPALAEIATLTEANTPDLALAARERLREVEPRNVQNLLDLRALATRLDRADVALTACRAVLETHPDNLEAMRGIAELELAQGHPDAAIEAYRAILRAHPKAVNELRKGLELAREAGRPEIVREFASATLSVDPVDLSAQLALARTLSGGGDVPGALKAYDALLAAHPGELPYLLEKKEVVARANDPALLAPVLDELFRLDPTRTEVAVERGNLYLGLAYDRPEGSQDRDRAARTALVCYERASRDSDAAGVAELGIARASRLVDDHERAIRAYESFLEREQNHLRHDVLKELGHALRETGRYSEAAEAYGRAIAGGLEDADLFWGAVEALAQLNQDARALQLLELLLRREPTNPLFLRKKGQLLLKAGRRSEALSALQQAVQSSHGDPHSYFEVAEALRAQGAYADAISYYRQGLGVDPKNLHGRLALAETLQLAGQYSEVVQIVDPLLTEEPNDLAAWKVRGDALRSLGRPTEVLYSLRAILLLEPENGPALLEMYRLHRDSKETKEAYETLTRLLATAAPEAQDATLHLERGDLAADLGLTEEANQSYERAAQIDPVYRVEIAIRRARLRLTAGRPDLALEVLDEGLKAQPEGTPSNLGALLLRAEILGALERPAEARAAFEEARHREPKSPVALAGIAKSMLEEGKHAEASEFLRGAIPQAPPQESLYLLLAEAESGLGHLDLARDALHKGVEVLPKSVALWARLGELGVVQQSWPEASGSFAHALALAPADVEILLRAGFVAERMQHPNEALALYERATEADPANKQAWTSRGLALIATGRPTDALACFDRSLGLDSDFAPAKDGKKVATQKTRDGEIQRFGREALLLESRVNRTVAKNDLFVTLHVPYEFLDPVLAALSRTPKVDLEQLEAADVRDLESASFHLITAALERRPAGIERRGFTLADVAVLSPATYSLDQIERLFGYLKAVLEADLRPENLALTPDVEELARQALGLPPEQRTLFQIVKNLRVGIYKARLIKVVEEAGSAVHAPLPSLDLGAYSPEFRGSETGEAPPGGEQYYAPEAMSGSGTVTAPEATPAAWTPVAPGPTSHAASASHAPPDASASVSRCVGCGGIASVVHSCSAPLCQHCIGQFPNCPKCGQPISTATTRALEGVVVHSSAARPPGRTGGALGGLKGVFSRSKAPTPTAKPGVSRPEHAAKPGHPAGDRSKTTPPPPPHRDTDAPATKEAKPVPKAIPEPPPPPSPTAPKPRREKHDDEPRL
ncbi:MAG: tetratricopeptide repeat protein [Thermoplasmata archaeon]